MSAFGTYLIGFVVLVIGLAIVASLLGVPTVWIGAGVVGMIGIGIITASSRNPRGPQPPTGGCGSRGLVRLVADMMPMPIRMLTPTALNIVGAPAR